MIEATKKKPKPRAPGVEKLFYRRHEAAYALGLSLRKIDYLVTDRKLTTRRVGRCVVIPAADVRRIAAEIMRSDLVPGTRDGSKMVIAST